MEHMNMKTGITACSNPQQADRKEQNDVLVEYLQSAGCTVDISNCIYESDAPITERAQICADELTRMFADPEIEEIYDISGGDMANEVLDLIDFDVIGQSSATFWGYSDLTTVINAIYSQTGKSSVLYQVKHLADTAYGEVQRSRYANRDTLFNVEWTMLQGDAMEGVVVGGNIRCFLKLAGTRYMPDLWGKILFLESLGGTVPQMITYLSQLRSLGVFEEIGGIALGTFTMMEKEKCEPDIVELVKHFAGPDMPIAKTAEVGHGRDAKALRIGEWISIGTQKLRLRPFRRPDADAIVSWANRMTEKAFYQWTAGIMGPYPLTVDKLLEITSGRDFNTRYFPFVMVKDDKVAGFFSFRQLEEDDELLRYGFVIVDPAIKGKGYGKRMLELGARFALDVFGAKRLGLGVFADNPAAMHCYKAFGFKENGVTEDFEIGGEKWLCIEMEKTR